jgi:hypothetical protein
LTILRLFFYLINFGGADMSDFLKNLRGSQKKNITDRKKNLDGHYYPQNDSGKKQGRTTKPSKMPESLWANLEDSLPQLVNNVAALTHHLEQLVEQNELVLEARIRQYNASALFFDNLNRIFSEDLFGPASGRQSKPTASYASGTHYTKDDILTTIRSMRAKGETYAIIADHLRKKGIPTFSGRGEWHAQTIHRLCKHV